MAGTVRRRSVSAFGRLWLLALVVVAWEIASDVVMPLVNPVAGIMLPSPIVVLWAFYEFAARGTLAMHVAASVRRVLMAAGVAAAIAIPLGVAMGWSKGVRRPVEPVVEFFRPIPPLAWIPLSILWFGIGDTQNQFIIFLAAFFPMLLNTISGVQGVDKNLIRAAESHGANRWNVFWTVVLRGALPTIFVGVRVGLGIGWMALVAAELVAATSGLGFLINNARNVFRTDHVVLGMAVIGMLGLAMDFGLRRLGRLLMPWHPSFR